MKRSIHAWKALGLAFLLAFLCTSPGSAQNWNWAKKAGGTSDEYATAIAKDLYGNSYVTGYFSGTIQIGSTTLISSGGTDIFIAKYDVSGNVVWAKKAGGFNADAGYGIAVDASGNSYITGYFISSASFGGSWSPNGSGGFDIFIAKYDASGNTVWARSAGGSNNEAGYGIAVDASGNSYITGYFTGVATFGSTAIGSNGGTDAFIAKYDASGNVVWKTKAGGTSADAGRAIGIDAYGNSYITGNFQGTATFGTTSLISSGSNDIFISKFNASGNIVWAKKTGGTSDDYGYGIATDAAGNSYMTGEFRGSANFGSATLSSTGGADIFVTKYDATGNMTWAKKAGGTSDDLGRAISLDAYGNSHLTGCFLDTAGFDSTTLISSGGTDICIAKYDASGNVTWAKQAGGTSDDVGLSIATDASGNSFLAGNFKGTASFGSASLSSSGSADAFIVKIGNAPAIFSFTPNEGKAGTSVTISGIDFTNATSVSFNGTAASSFTVNSNTSITVTVPNGFTDGPISVATPNGKGPSYNSFTFGPAWNWAKSAGGTTSEIGRSIARDAYGNTYVTGVFGNSISFGALSLTSRGGGDIFIAKYDISGNLTWLRQAGGSALDDVSGIASDAAGNSYITGYFSGTATFGSTSITSSGAEDIFIAKYDAAGNLVWVKRAGGTMIDKGNGIGVDAAGNTYVTGSFEGTGTFGGLSLVSTGGSDAFIIKFDASGNTAWAKKGGSVNYDYCHSLSIDGSGNIYITGIIGGAATFGSASFSKSNGGFDIFIVKYDPSGNAIWAKKAGGNNDERTNSIAADASGNFYITGYFDVATTFGTINLTSNGNYDAFIAKYNSSGNVVWAKKIGGKKFETGYGLATDASGNCYATGYFSDTANFDAQSVKSNGGSNVYIAQYDSSGSLVWVTKAAAGSSQGFGITVDNSGNQYVTGVFSGKTIFGADTLTGILNSDFFIAKIGKAPIISSFDPSREKEGKSVTIKGIGFSNATSVRFNGTEAYSFTVNNDTSITATVPTRAKTGRISVSTAEGTAISYDTFTFIPTRWARQYGLKTTDLGQAIAVDAEGNNYTTGYYNGKVPFGHDTLATNGGNDIFIAKHDNNGNLKWTRKAGGPSHDYGFGVAIDALGNSFITGYFQGKAKFSTATVTSAGGPDVFIAKFDSSGKEIWARQAGGQYIDYGYAIAADGSGNCYVTGYFYGSIKFGPVTLNSAGYYDIFIAKYDASGNLVWAKQAGGNGYDYGYGIALDRTGNIFITGLFSGTTTIGSTSLTSSGGTDILIAKYDASGNAIWARKAGGNGADAAFGIALDAQGKIYLTGHFTGNASFGGKSLSSTGTTDIFVAKYGASGNIVWARKAGSTTSDYGRSIAVDSSANCYVTGYFQRTANFGPTSIISRGGTDVFLAKYDSAGNQKWVQQAGGAGNDYGYGIGADDYDNAYATGSFTGKGLYGQDTLAGIGNTDIFITKTGTLYEASSPSGSFAANQENTEDEAIFTGFIPGDPMAEMPAELLSFSAGLKDQSVALLMWETSAGKDAEYFIVERSVNGVDFIEAGLINGNGAAAMHSEYGYEDNISAVTSSILYYRLKQANTDGSIAYSDIRTIQLAKGSINAWYNPSNEQLNISISSLESGNARLTLVDAQGRPVAEKSAGISTGEYRLTMDMHNLAKGMYTLIVTTANRTDTVKVVKY